MILTYQYQLILKPHQYRLMSDIVESQRQLYNAALTERIDHYKRTKNHIDFKSITRFDQYKSLTEIRSFDDRYGDIPTNLSRWTLDRLNDAYTGFFSRTKKGAKGKSVGFPRYRSKTRWNTIGFNSYNGFRIIGNRILFKPFSSGIRLRNYLKHPLPDNSVIKCCSFTRRNGKWWINVQFEIPNNIAVSENAIGLDVGIEYLVTDSNGKHYKNIRPNHSRYNAIRLARRALSRCKKGSKRRQKVRARLAKLTNKVKNIRSNYLHHVSKSIVSNKSLIFIENIKIKNITKSAKGNKNQHGTNVKQKKGLNKSIQDAAWGILNQYISYKAESAGGKVIKVSPNYTSQDCSGCGKRIPKKLTDRLHVCDCGLVLQRDVNAAKNILAKGLSLVGEAGRSLGGDNVISCDMRSLVNTYDSHMDLAGNTCDLNLTGLG